MGIVDGVRARLRRERFTVRVVHPSDLNALLGSLGLLEAIEKEAITCENCECHVEKERIGKIYAEHDQIKVLCDDVGCFFSEGGAQVGDDDHGDGGTPADTVTSESIATDEEVMAALEEDPSELVV